jgi:iron(III) transport system substrate-binding protein
MISVLKSLFATLALVLASGAAAQVNLATYDGADRLERIIAAAKKEGTLTLYTTIAEKDLPVLIKPFETKYGIKVSVWRAGTDKVLQRTLAEASANRREVDVIHFGSPEMEALSREKVLQPVLTPAYRDLVPGSVPKHHEWAGDIALRLGAGLQHEPRQESRSAKDLCGPSRSQMEGQARHRSQEPGLVRLGGRDHGRRRKGSQVLPGPGRAQRSLDPQRPHSADEHGGLGRVPLALTVYNYMPEQAKKKGRADRLVRSRAGECRSNAVGCGRRAPHPCGSVAVP